MFLGGSDGKESVYNADSIRGSGRSPGEGNGYPLQYSCLENPGTERPGCTPRLQSIALQRAGYDWSDLAHTGGCLDGQENQRKEWKGSEVGVGWVGAPESSWQIRGNSRLTLQCDASQSLEEVGLQDQTDWVLIVALSLSVANYLTSLVPSLLLLLSFSRTPGSKPQSQWSLPHLEEWSNHCLLAQ